MKKLRAGGRLRLNRRVHIPLYEVRTNCEFVTYVWAPSADKAMKRANQTDVQEWDQAWAPWEAAKLE